MPRRRPPPQTIAAPRHRFGRRGGLVLALLLNPLELGGELLLGGLDEGVRRSALQQRERIFDAAGARQTLRTNHDVASVTLGRAAGPLFERRGGVGLQPLGALVSRLDAPARRRRRE